MKLGDRVDVLDGGNVITAGTVQAISRYEQIGVQPVSTLEISCDDGRVVTLNEGGGGYRLSVKEGDYVILRPLIPFSSVLSRQARVHYVGYNHFLTDDGCCRFLNDEGYSWSRVK